MSTAPEEEKRPAALAPSVARGMVWAYLTFAGSKAFVFASTVVLARLLTPADYGIVGFATIVTDYLDTLRDFGVGQALIQRKTQVQEAANATFIISLLSGLALFVLSLALAPVTAAFFNQPKVIPLLSVLALTYIISSFGTVNDSLLLKELDFRHRAAPEVIRAIVKGGSTIALALLGYGVWSLVLGQVIGAFVSTAALWFIYPWRPSRLWDAAVAKSIFRFGGHMVVLGIMGNIEVNLDYLIVGKRLGETALGLYSLAFRGPELLIINTVSVIADVIFPAYSRIQDDPAALRHSLLTALRYVSLIVIPGGMGLALISGPFVEAFYTHKWEGAIPAMQVLAIYASIRAITYNIGDVYKAMGRPDILNKLGIVSLALIVPGLWIGAGYGIVGVASAHLTVAVINFSMRLLVVWRLFGIPPWVMLRTISGSIGSVLVMAVAMQIATVLAGDLPSGLLLALLIAVGGATYGACAWAVNRTAIEAALPVIRKSLHLRSPVAAGGK